MDWDQIFSLSSSIVLPAWLILILAPRRIRLLGLAVRYAVPLVLSALYTALMAVHFAGSGGDYGSIEAVRQLFASDPVLVAGWAHYLAFDLFVGSILAERMDRAGVHRVVQAPILVLTFLFGPVGFLLGLATEALLKGAPRTVKA